MPCVKAMGVDLRARNLAQVSMNLTDFEQTPIHQVFETVKREPERLGVGIVGSEIVGLIPRRAIEMTAEFYLRVENFSPQQVLENRLEESLERADGKAIRIHDSGRHSRSPSSTSWPVPHLRRAEDRLRLWLVLWGPRWDRWWPIFRERRNLLQHSPNRSRT